MFFFLRLINHFFVIINIHIIKIIPFLISKKKISKSAIERLDLLILALETIDLNASESLFSISNKLNFEHIFPSKISIWHLRIKNPMRKSFSNKNINFDDFDALVRVTSEMSKYLYPYIRAILDSKDSKDLKPELWNDFKNRFKELIEERFNTKSIRVQNLTDNSKNDILYSRMLLTLSLSISEDGYIRLKNLLLQL